MPVLHNRPRSRFTRHNAFSSRHVPRACRDAILSGAIRSRLVGALLHGARIPPTPGGASGAGVAPPDPAVGPIPGAKTHPTGSQPRLTGSVTPLGSAWNSGDTTIWKL